MAETSKTPDMHEPLIRLQLIDLYKHYWTVLHKELDFCHQYLNFYTGLLSAILAATILGFLNIKFGDPHALALLLGPVLIVVLAINGHSTVQTFYRRFAEAWVTTINIESMLDIRYPKGQIGETIKIKLDPEPVYISYEKSFIPTYYWPAIKEFFEQAKNDKWYAEDVAQELGKKGTTLANAKITFFVFGVIAAILLGIILAAAIPYCVLEELYYKELPPDKIPPIRRWIRRWRTKPSV